MTQPKTTTRRLTPPYEHTTTTERTLIMEYTVRQRVVLRVRPGQGGVGYAISEAARYIDHVTDVDPRSVRFTLTDER